tara:strand:+ start:208 stop:402 length:195 start_codon:yes stop_codon:yes gene_type:complete
VRREFDPRVSELAVGRLALRCEVAERRLASQARLQAAASEVRHRRYCRAFTPRPATLQPSAPGL